MIPLRTTVDTGDTSLKEAVKLTKAKTKREALRISLEDLVKRNAKRKRIERLISTLGNFQINLTLEELEKMRADD